jgi:predicted DNA-binding transcriptional regulator AlpA
MHRGHFFDHWRVTLAIKRVVTKDNIMQTELLDRSEVCTFFGGTKAIDPATLYRGIRVGRYPRPVKVGGSSRWLRTECETALRVMVEGRR